MFNLLLTRQLLQRKQRSYSVLQDSVLLTIRVPLSLKHVRAASFFLLVAHSLWRLAVVASGKSSLPNAVCPLNALFNSMYLRFASVRTSLLLMAS
jgi:hypothetical protein